MSEDKTEYKKVDGKWENIKNITMGAAKIAQALIGIDQTDPIERANRLSICSSCIKEDHMKCKECGCYLQFKTKIKSENCPLDYWNNPDKVEKKITPILSPNELPRISKPINTDNSVKKSGCGCRKGK